MKKSVSLLLSAALALGSLASVANAADTELTALQKFEALKAKGIFTGVNDAGDAGLDQKMNRAQFARVAALISGLDPDNATVTAAPFTDVPLGKWYTEEAAVVKGAGIMVGNPDGSFNPTGDITVQDLAIVAAKLLNLTPVADAKVDGAAGYAGPYIQALLDAGVAFPTNYTEAAIRSDLVNVSYVAYEALNKPAVAAISTFSQSGAKLLKVEFNQAVDTSKATIAVKRGSIAVNFSKTTWSDDKKSVTLEAFSNLVEGDYTVSVTGLTESALTGTVKVEASKVKTIAFNGDALVQTSAGANTARIGYKITNQFGEDITNGTAVNPYTSESGGVLAASGTATVTFSGGITVGTSVATVTIVDPNTGVSAAGSFKVSAPATAATYEIGELKNKDNKVLRTNSNVTTDKFQFDVVVKDQYGNEIPGSAAASVNTDTLISPSIAGLTASFVNGSDNKLKLEITGVPANAGTYNIILVGKNSGKSATATVKIEAPISVKSFTLLQPTDQFYVGESTYIPFEAYDQYGNKLTKADDLSGVTLSVSDTTHGSIAIEKNPVTGEGKIKVTLDSSATANSTLFVMSVVTSEAKTSQVSGKVNEAAKPVRIAGLASDSGVVTKLIKGGATTVVNADKFVLKDQYERDIALNKVAGYKIKLAAADGTIDAVSSSDGDDVLNPGDTTTISTAGKGAGSETLVFTLNDGTSDIANSSYQVTFSSVEKSVVSSYIIDTADKIYAPTGTTATTLSGATAAEAAYAKDVTVYGKDSAGEKIALVSSDVSLNSTSANLEYNGSKIFAQKVADASKDETGTLVGIIQGANGTETVTKTVTLTNAAPVATSFDVKASSDSTTYVSFADGVAVLTRAQVTAQNAKNVASNLGTVTDVFFEVKDQYDVASAAVKPAYFTISAADAAGNALDTTHYNIGGTTGTLTVGTPVAGDVITITAIMNDGKTKVLKIVVVS